VQTYKQNEGEEIGAIIKKAKLVSKTNIQRESPFFFSILLLTIISIVYTYSIVVNE